MMNEEAVSRAMIRFSPTAGNSSYCGCCPARSEMHSDCDIPRYKYDSWACDVSDVCADVIGYHKNLK